MTIRDQKTGEKGEYRQLEERILEGKTNKVKFNVILCAWSELLWC